MCIPGATTAVMIAATQFVVGAASAVAGYIGKKQEYKAQAKQYKQNAKNAKTATINRFGQINAKILQENEAAQQDQFEQNVKGAQARGTALAAGAEGGVEGLSVDALLADYYTQQGRYTANLNRNLDIQTAYLQQEKVSAQAQGQNQINSVPRPTAPSFLGTAIRIAGEGLDAFGSYNKNRLAYG